MAKDDTVSTRSKSTPFSDKALKNLKPEVKRYRKTDAGCAGLFIEVTPNGKKNWGFRFRLDKKTFNMGLKASYPYMTLAEARAKVDEHRSLLARGINPQEQRDAEDAKRAEESKPLLEAVTFKQAYEDYCRFKTAKVGSNAPQWSYETLKKHNNRMYKHVMPSLGERIVHELTERDLEQVLLAIQEHGTLSNRDKVRSLFTGLFDWVAYKIRDPDTDKPLMDRNIALYIAKAPFYKHESKPFKHVKSIDDLKSVVQGIHLMSCSYEVKMAIKLAMLLFLRPSNIVKMRWEQIDFENTLVTYTAEDMKMREDFTTPLPRQAIEILKELECLTGHSPYVFLSPYGSGGKPIVRDALSSALRRNGITEISPHGFRHSASTLLNDAGHGADEIEAQLSHSISGTRGIYNRANYVDRRRLLLQQWADILDELRIQ